MEDITVKKFRKSIKSYFKRIKYSFKYDYEWLKVLNSPFIGLKIKWYFGKISIGIPYFLPRKWVKVTKIDCEKLLQEDIQRCLPERMNGRTWEYYKNHKKPVPIKYFGINYTSLGWKTKWNDYRFEWAPSLSIVIFGKQLFIWVIPKCNYDQILVSDCYWEAWINYNFRTNSKLSKKERLLELFKIYSCSWGNDEKGYTDYYLYILKDKYLNFYKNNKI